VPKLKGLLVKVSDDSAAFMGAIRRGFSLGGRRAPLEIPAQRATTPRLQWDTVREAFSNFRFGGGEPDTSRAPVCR
jgi:hypothetical protein